ncbi:mitochondrial genome maintenance MGM101 [Agrocybe pediades]|nr:mitochondrial genome maintenance MGM101 [Agrocybe pediades]
MNYTQSASTPATPASNAPQNANAAPAAPSPSPLPDVLGSDGTTDWSRSYSGLSAQPFPKEITDVLLAPIDPMDVEMKPDGLIYLPEIKYRRILNKAFGPGGWGLAPRTETNVGPKIVSREYALVCLGRLVAIARGEQEYFDPSGVATATEACKSNALMRCCKDLGIASELWDPRFIREFKAKYCVEVFAEHIPTKKKKKLWRRKDQPKFGYPYQE